MALAWPAPSLGATPVAGGPNGGDNGAADGGTEAGSGRVEAARGSAPTAPPGVAQALLGSAAWAPGAPPSTAVGDGALPADPAPAGAVNPGAIRSTTAGLLAASWRAAAARSAGRAAAESDLGRLPVAPAAGSAAAAAAMPMSAAAAPLSRPADPGTDTLASSPVADRQPDLVAEAAADALALTTQPEALAIALPAASPIATLDRATGLHEVHIPTALTDPGFAPTLGATLSLLARDGVTQARLNLHPAEMGPITVQIALDGTAARVDFQADVAATRAALEAALPALASAMQDAGLSLSGAAVFPPAADAPGGAASGQAGNSGGGLADPGQPRRRFMANAASAALAEAPQGLFRATRGIVDLVA